MNSSLRISRRAALTRLGLLAGAAQASAAFGQKERSAFRVATFQADVTVPLGHGMMGGAWLSKSIADPLEAHGVVFLGGDTPVVFVSVDWCEIRNEAYARWQTVLAEAAGTKPERVMISTVHQHDAPVADLAAERILRARSLSGTVCDLDFHEHAVQTAAQSLRDSLSGARSVTHIGTGKARVERVASLRRYVTPEGEVRFDRTSATKNPVAASAAEGGIDPWLRTLSFWSGEEAVAALHFYAVHPMSYYGQGEVSADFPGIARRRRQAETPTVAQIYISGCSGNVTAGKYNTGARDNRAVLAGRIYDGIAAAWSSTQRIPAHDFVCRIAPLVLEARSDAGFTPPDLESQLTPETRPFTQCLAAMGLSWRERLAAGRPLEIPAIDFGVAQILLLPGESYVDFQLAAQQMRPDQFVCVAGYGDGATGYIPTENYVVERDSNLRDWCWVAPGSGERLVRAMRQALSAPDQG